MSVLGNLFGRIFHHDSGGAAAAGTPTSTASTGSAQATPSAGSAQSVPTPSGAAPQPNTQAVQNQPSGNASGGTATMERVDIEQVLNDMAARNPQKLNWRSSIVDLMKLVGMDSSLQERKQLADELGYKGDRNDSATMNIWLHKEVMKKMQENGGKVPADLL